MYENSLPQTTKNCALVEIPVKSLTSQPRKPKVRNWEALYLWKKHRHRVLPDKKKTIPRKRKHKDES